MKAFEAALDGGKPLYLQSALPLLTMKNVKQDKLIYVNIGGKNQDKNFNPIQEAIKKSSLHDRPWNFQQTPPSFTNTIYRNDLNNLSPITKRST